MIETATSRRLRCDSPSCAIKRLIAALWLAIALPTSICAQPAPARTTAAVDWPAKTIRMIVPFPPASSPDLVARLLNDKLGAALGQPVIVQNSPGASGNLGTALVVNAAPDGYTIGLSAPGPLAVNTVLYSKLEYDPFKDLAAITLVAESPNVLVIYPGLAIASVKELVALAKSQPGKLNYGSVGNGSASHLTMEMLKSQAGIDIVHVPFPGSPQVNTALAGGEIAAGFVVPATAMSLVKAGRLKAVAVTSAARSDVLRDLPTVAEAGFPGFQSTLWFGAVAPAKTPRPIIGRFSTEMVRIIRTDEVRNRLASIYFTAIGSTPEAFASFMREEVERWDKVIKATGAKAD